MTVKKRKEKKRKKKKTAKRSSTKTIKESLWEGDGWVVVRGELKPGKGRPFKVAPLFKFVAEKLPYEAFGAVKKWMKKNSDHREGVYLAHDSMGTARYGGRGQIFHRLAARKKKNPRELTYFSFYVVEDKKHEREIETAILRSAGPQMILNQRKVRDGIDPGNIRDYEPGTLFFERQRKKGKRKARAESD